MRLHLPALAAAMGAPVPTGWPAHAVGLCTDSRRVRPGELFVALHGERFDGHAFVSQAMAEGAVGAVVSQTWAQAQPDAATRAMWCAVPEPLAALHAIARWCRAQQGVPVVGITGSNGKTTTKQLLAAALGVRGAVHATLGNLNNHIGVPLTLAAWPDDAWAAVVEMGMSAPGEIAQLAALARPDVALVTCVAPAHLAGFSSLMDVAHAKAEIYAALGERGVAVVNRDDAPLWAAAQPVLRGRPTLLFGRHDTSDVQILHARMRVQPAQNAVLQVALLVEGHRHEAELPLLGAHHGHNVAATVAAAWALGVSPSEALLGMQQVELPPSRLSLQPLPALDGRVLDDCYNANPGSMAASVQVLAELAAGGRAVAVIGEMLELGPSAGALHQEAGRNAAAAGVQLVLAVGEHAEQTAQGARAAGAQAMAFAQVPEAIDAVPRLARTGDTFLVKGSRGMRLERVVAALHKLTPHRAG